MLLPSLWFITIHRFDIPFTDFSKQFERKTVTEERYYFTDHHWTTLTGFAANKHICEKLNGLYGFSYNKDYVDLNNYHVANYHDWFLGSSGKKLEHFSLGMVQMILT